jgi:hypothetical protein
MGNQARDNALTKFDRSAGKSLLEILLEASSHGITEESTPAPPRKTKDVYKPVVATKKRA